MRVLIVFCILMSFNMGGFAQKLTIDIEGYPTVTKEFGKSIVLPNTGFGLSYFYGPYSSGFSYRSIAWGSEMAIHQGLNLDVWSNEKIVVGNQSQLHIGLPLFHNKLAVSFGLTNRFNLKFKRVQRLYLSGGLGYHINPSYQRISDKYQFLEGIIALHIAILK